MIQRPARTLLAPLLAGALLLGGCGPHPAAGVWHAAPRAPSTYTRIEIEFDGKAYLYVTGREDHAVRCFWAGDDRSTVNMDCIVNDPSERRLRYRLQVISGSESELFDNGNTLGRFVRNTD